MNKLSKLSLAVIAALGLGLSGCGSSSSSSNGTIADNFAVMVSRGDVYGATVTDSASTPHLAVQVEGKNEYKFSVPESEIEFPIKVNGGYVDVNDNGIIEADIDTKLNIEMKSYDGTVTPVTTYLADFPTEADRDAKLQELVDLVNANNDVSAPDVTTEDLLKPASDVDFDTAVAINAVYAELTDVENSGSTFDLNDVNGSYNTIREEVRARNGVNATSEDIEKYTMEDLNIPTLSKDDVSAYLDSMSNLSDLTLDTVADLQGQTVYTMDLDANPATYTKLELPETIDADTEVTTTKYELEDGQWVEVNDEVTATATLDSDMLTLVIEDGDEKITNEIVDLPTDGSEITTVLSVEDLTANLDGFTTETPSTENGTIYLEMTVEMTFPSTISSSID